MYPRGYVQNRRKVVLLSVEWCEVNRHILHVSHAKQYHHNQLVAHGSSEYLCRLESAKIQIVG